MSDLLSEALQTAVATQSEYQLASIFELLAQENLRHSVRPAFEYLVKVIANRKPETFSWLLRYFDELFTVVELAVQHHFLRSHIASYSELYYGLRRKIKGLKIESHKTLDQRRHFLSLITLCILPYFALKLQRLYARTAENEDQRRLPRLLELLFLYVYPVAFTLWELARLWCQFQYAVHQNKYFDPLLKILKIKLVVENSAASQASSNMPSQVITRMISGGVHAGIFLLQFIEWWYGDGSQTANKITSTVTPDAPVEKQSVPSSTCPLCQRIRTNHTVLSTSGYVFCYTCIYKYVKGNSRCPVTGFPSQIEHLVKLYLPE